MRQKNAESNSPADLAVALRSNDWASRSCALKQAIEAFEDRKRSSKATLLLIARSLLFDPEPTTRSEAVDALYKYGSRGDYRAAIHATQDEEWQVRCTAYSLLAKLGKRSAKKRLMCGMKDCHPIVRRYAAVGLYDALGPDSIAYLEAALRSEKDVLARPGFLHGLAVFGFASAREELAELSSEPNAWISSPAKASLKMCDEGNLLNDN